MEKMKKIELGRRHYYDGGDAECAAQGGGNDWYIWSEHRQQRLWECRSERCMRLAWAAVEALPGLPSPYQIQITADIATGI